MDASEELSKASSSGRKPTCRVSTRPRAPPASASGRRHASPLCAMLMPMLAMAAALRGASCGAASWSTRVVNPGCGGGSRGCPPEHHGSSRPHKEV